MHKSSPLIVVDDDAEDQELMTLALNELGCEHDVKMFSSAEAALDYLYTCEEQPFMIVSDINMPKMDGISFKRKIDTCDILKAKCIPFIFLSTSTRFIQQTCDLNIQGYFEKGSTWQDLSETMNIIFTYWKRTKHMLTN
jgi:two-component SAPR family response regulator